MLWTTQYQTCLHQSVSPLWRHAHTHTPLDSPFFLKPCTKNRTPQTAITNVHPSRNTLAQKNTQCLCASPCSLLHTPASSATLRNMSKSSPRSACLFLCKHSRNIASIFMRSAEGLPERGGYQSLIEGGSPSTSSTLFCQVVIS